MSIELEVSRMLTRFLALSQTVHTMEDVSCIRSKMNNKSNILWYPCGTAI